MAFHPEKCVVIQISSKRSTISANYTLHNHQLDVVDSSKYLGVTINKNLRWDDHINSITARVNRTLGFLKRNLRGCKISARARAYEVIVRPTLLHLYGTHITSGKLTNLKRYRDERHDLPPIITQPDSQEVSLRW